MVPDAGGDARGGHTRSSKAWTIGWSPVECPASGARMRWALAVPDSCKDAASTTTPDILVSTLHMSARMTLHSTCDK